MTHLTKPARLWLGFAVAAALAVAAMSTPVAAVAQADRIGGTDRFHTAALLSERQDACEVVVASGRDFPDGLTGAVFARPILLTEPDRLPPATAAELGRLTTRCGLAQLEISVLGGTAAVSATVFDQLRGHADNVERLGGANRYETAVTIATRAAAMRDGDLTEVILATGANFPDALAGGPLAAKLGPIILNDGDTLRPEVAAFFADHPSIDKAYVLGGPAAVPNAIDLQLAADFDVATQRLAGADRFATAVQIADQLSRDTSFLCALLVNGGAFPDALAAGPFAANSCPILLVNRDTIPAATLRALGARSASLRTIYVIGGTAVISDAAHAAAVAALTPASITSATVTNSDFTQAVFEIAGPSLTVTARPLGANDGVPTRDGPFGNVWSIDFDNAPNRPVPYVWTGTHRGPDGVRPQLVMSADFEGMTYQDFVTGWNRHGVIGVARTTTPEAVLSAAPGNVDGPTTPGTADAELVLTFDKPIVDPTPFAPGQARAKFPRLTWLVPPIIDLATAATQSTSGDGTTLTLTWDDTEGFVPLPTQDVRIDQGTIVSFAGLPSHELIAPIEAAGTQ